MTINEYIELRKHQSSSLSSSDCKPPIGKTYLTIGQDLFSIQEYFTCQYNFSLHHGSTEPMSSFHPATSMFYTDIQTLRGLSIPIDYGSGIEYSDGLVEQQQVDIGRDGDGGMGIQIGLWLNGTTGCQDIIDGKLHTNIHNLFKYLKRIQVTKIFLRVGYEFDNPYFGYSDNPKVYSKAFRYMVQICEKQLGYKHCHRKIAFVWHSWGAPRATDDVDLQDFYPGNNYVDWIGVSIFQQVYPWANNNNNNASDSGGEFAGGNIQQVVEVLEFAQNHNKPIMIAESTPFGWNVHNHNNNNNSAVDNNNVWDIWFQPTLNIIEQYDIGMWSYINCDWESQPMWKGVGFGNTLLSKSNDIMTKWKHNILDNPRFMNRLDCDGRNHGSSRHYYQSQNSKKSLYVGMIWNNNNSEDTAADQQQKIHFWIPILVAMILLVIVGIWKFCYNYWKKRRRESYGYFEINEETQINEEEGLGEIKKLFGSSTRLNVEAEEKSLRQSISSTSSSFRKSITKGGGGSIRGSGSSNRSSGTPSSTSSSRKGGGGGGGGGGSDNGGRQSRNGSNSNNR